MRTTLLANLVFLGVCVAGVAQTPSAPAPARGRGDVVRGEYLVRSVAMCVQCHSPRDAGGRIVEDKLLSGAPLPVTGPAWSPRWPSRTPHIAGLPGLTDDQVVMLLTQGHAGDRPPPSPPMPPFRMNVDDARAVVAYLRSLESR